MMQNTLLSEAAGGLCPLQGGVWQFCPMCPGMWHHRGLAGKDGAFPSAQRGRG